jgi:glycosyltransferase involved in cell wall biosynthesis
MSSPTITIGIPCRNGEQTLPLTLKSIYAQTFQDWELIIVNDGSTDGTAAILNALDDPRVRVVHHADSARQGVRFNEIIDLARGVFIARMDADDVMFPDRLDRQIDVLMSNPDADLLGGGVVMIDKNEVFHGIRVPPEQVTSPWQIFRGEVIYQPTIVARTKWFRNNRYDAQFGLSEDYELWVRATPHLTIMNLQEPVLFYRETSDVLTTKYWVYSKQSRRAMRMHGPSRIGTIPTQWLILRRLAKDMVYRMFVALGLQTAALQLRNTTLPEADKTKYAAILDQIRAVQLPLKKTG